MRIPLDVIQVRTDARSVDGGAVSMLAESMNEIGLLNPIRVRERDDHYEVSAGRHRLTAAQSLGWADIEAVVVNDSDLDAELVMIDENLCRAELSPADRAHYTARRKAIYEEKHPETALGANQHTRVGKVCQPSFSEDTATKTGESARVVRLHAERGEKIAPGVLSLVRGSHLDNGLYLDTLKKLPVEEQRGKAERDLAAGKKRQERHRRDKGRRSAGEVQDQFAALLSAWKRAGPEARERFRSQFLDADERCSA